MKPKYEREVHATVQFIVEGNSEQELDDSMSDALDRIVQQTLGLGLRISDVRIEMDTLEMDRHEKAIAMLTKKRT